MTKNEAAKADTTSLYPLLLFKILNFSHNFLIFNPSKQIAIFNFHFKQKDYPALKNQLDNTFI